MGLEMHPSLSIHPGEWLLHEIVEAYGLSVTRCAAHLGVSRQNLSALLNGRAALSAMMALRFEKAFGIKADTLLRMQVAYDLAQLRLSGAEPDVKRLEAAYRFRCHIFLASARRRKIGRSVLAGPLPITVRAELVEALSFLARELREKRSPATGSRRTG